ncbi:hypothetical protein CLOP_g12822 [Closterium sp. NIES-67]|nr:hypothetical protein CLOP_g12822 [Closterium sp. NIES-67]
MQTPDREKGSRTLEMKGRSSRRSQNQLILTMRSPERQILPLSQPRRPMRMMISRSSMCLQLHREADLGEVKYYLGMQIERDESGILIHQERYILNMLQSFGLSEANPVRTPLPTGFDVHAYEDEPLLRDELVKLYQSIVGSLIV